MTGNEPKIAGLLLAAGGSRRLGRPKQLLEFEGKTLLRRAVEALLDAGCEPVTVVLGADAEMSRAEIADLDLETIENADWKSGMSSSITAGVSHLAARGAEAVLIALCDQPRVTGKELRRFIDGWSSATTPILAAEYNGIRGVPAVFSREMFDQLLALNGDKGARELIRNFPSTGIELPEAAIDIDTPADLEHAVTDLPSRPN